ncbi:hypothetical protein [Actinoallomurus sp. NPDC052274]|uniref:hypothetical protein n=1 Tax=Actinoallomurus sp. NPDC052274 TaxID=3155420 RepID=UPI0034354D61
MTTAPDLVWLFPGEAARTEPIANHHRALTEAIEHLASARDVEVSQAVIEGLTSRVVTIATEFASAIEPLIIHLPAITSALRDAAYYRHLDSECCAQDPDCRVDVPCGAPAHGLQQNLADAYTTALHAITG